MSDAAARARRASPHRPIKAGDDAVRAVAALRLLGRWQRVSGGHVAFSGACACGPGATVDLRECDDLIFDYLARKFAGVANIHALIVAHAGGRLSALITAIAQAPGALKPGAAEELLHALEASITSFEDAHRR